jgi:hypothetical protein
MASATKMEACCLLRDGKKETLRKKGRPSGAQFVSILCPGLSLRSPPGYCLATLRVAEGRFEGARSQAFSLGYTMTGFQRLIGRGRFMPRPFWHLSNPSVIGGAIGD